MKDVLFKFEGAIYRFEHIATDKFCEHTRAPSKEKAISNFMSKAKSMLGYNNTAKVILDGYLTVYYRNTTEIYKVKDKTVTLIKSDFEPNEFTVVNGKVKYEGQYMSLEQAKLLASEPEEVNWYIVYENGNRECITGKFKKYMNTIDYNDEDYLYDDSEGVYWKNGIRYSDRIEEC